jgi:hypothetical protein
MDNGPSFSHLVMQRSFPTKTQQRPRLIAVPPKATRVCGVCPSDTPNTHHFCRHLEFPDSLDSLIKGGPRRESVWLAFKETTRHVCLNRGTPHETLTEKAAGVYVSNEGSRRAGKWMT